MVALPGRGYLGGNPDIPASEAGQAQGPAPTVRINAVGYYLQWWDKEFIPLLERHQFVLLGISFVVKNPPKFHQAVEKDQVDDLPLKHTVFRLLDEMEKVAKKDLLDFLRTHSIHFPVEHRDKIIERILEKTEGHYEQTVQELRILVAKSWNLKEGDKAERTSAEGGYDY